MHFNAFSPVLYAIFLVFPFPPTGVYNKKRCIFSGLFSLFMKFSSFFLSPMAKGVYFPKSLDFKIFDKTE